MGRGLPGAYGVFSVGRLQGGSIGENPVAVVQTPAPPAAIPNPTGAFIGAVAAFAALTATMKAQYGLRGTLVAMSSTPSIVMRVTRSVIGAIHAVSVINGFLVTQTANSIAGVILGHSNITGTSKVTRGMSSAISAHSVFNPPLLKMKFALKSTVAAQSVFSTANMRRALAIAAAVHGASSTSAGLSINGANTIDMSFLPTINRVAWNPGLNAVGGIPVRNTIHATLSPRGGVLDDTAQIQAAIDACPVGQVVKLNSGTFLINSGNYVLINRGVTLRGNGPTLTILSKTDGAHPDTEAVGANPSPLIVVGPSRFANHPPCGVPPGASTNLTVDGAPGDITVTVASVAGLSVGQLVLVDELSGASFITDPAGRGQVYASSDLRVVYQRHNPAFGPDDPFPDAFTWFSRSDRVTSEVKKIAAINSGTKVVTFETPLTIDYRVGHTAQLSTYEFTHTELAGVEDMKLTGGDNGQLRFQWASECWTKNIDNTVWHDEGFAIDSCYRVEIREFYVHDAAWPQPGGAGYAISFSTGSSECLIENGISVRANKVMVSRCSGAASVIAYCYADDGFINTNGNWQEVGINGSHMVGPHHMLFEGNYSFNADSDKTHGNSIRHTFFRNWFSGVRKSFVNPHDGLTYDDATNPGNGPLRCAGLGYYSYDHAFVGNVLGRSGQMAGWVYEGTFAGGDKSIWLLGWDDFSPYPMDTNVKTRTFRDGNWDFLNSHQTWIGSSYTLPNSLYVTTKPSFFNNGGGYTWPPVNPTTGSTATLPAKARFDAGTPFTQP